MPSSGVVHIGTPRRAPLPCPGDRDFFPSRRARTTPLDGLAGPAVALLRIVPFDRTDRHPGHPPHPVPGGQVSELSVAMVFEEIHREPSHGVKTTCGNGLSAGRGFGSGDPGALEGATRAPSRSSRRSPQTTSSQTSRSFVCEPLTHDASDAFPYSSLAPPGAGCRRPRPRLPASFPSSRSSG